MAEPLMPPSCGRCDDGYVTEPPLQDGGLCATRPCDVCRLLAQRFWAVHTQAAAGGGEG